MNFRHFLTLVFLPTGLAVATRSPAQQPAGPAQSSPPPLQLSPSELKIYEHATTVIDWTPQQIKSVPFLHKLNLAESQDKIQEILDRVGDAAKARYRDFAKVDCDERVYCESSLKNPLLSWGGMGSKSAVHSFRYIIVPKAEGNVYAFDEYRTDRSGKPVDGAELAGLNQMITSNFASSWLYFSPADQRDSRYRYLGTQSLQKRECYVVGFAQKPAVAHSVTGFRVEDRSAALLVQGIAWIDQQTFEIPKIMTWLLAPRPDIGLEHEDTLVDYSPVQPAGYGKVLWLPHEVTVTILYRRAYFRNVHRYSNFKLFRVESTIKPAD